jgi:hypothetical protein
MNTQGTNRATRTATYERLVPQNEFSEQRFVAINDAANMARQRNTNFSNKKFRLNTILEKTQALINSRDGIRTPVRSIVSAAENHRASKLTYLRSINNPILTSGSSRIALSVVPQRIASSFRASTLAFSSEMVSYQKKHNEYIAVLSSLDTTLTAISGTNTPVENARNMFQQVSNNSVADYNKFSTALSNYFKPFNEPTTNPLQPMNRLGEISNKASYYAGHQLPVISAVTSNYTDAVLNYAETSINTLAHDLNTNPYG